MRIGIFTESYRPYVSGVVRSVETFARELEKRGHEVFIFAPRYPGAGGEDGERVLRFPAFRSPTHAEFYIPVPLKRRARRFLAEHGIELIHVHSPFLLGTLGAALASERDLPLVFTYHTLYDKYVHYVPLAQGLARRAVVVWARAFCNRCDLVVAPTGPVRELLSSYGVKTPIVTIPTGIYPEQFSAGDPGFLRQRFGLPAEGKVVLFAGRLGKEKSPDFLLRAFARVASTLPEAYVVLVGSGPEAGNLKGLARRLGISERVVFTGLVPPEQMPSVYRSAAVFAFPSVTETQGLVVAEAMAAGLPVVARAAFGVRDVVADGVTGFLCGDDEEEFAEKLILVLEDSSLRERFGAAAKERALLFAAERQAARLERAYRALLEGDEKLLEELTEEPL